MNKLESQILINELEHRIKELESDKHINEIKAKAIGDFSLCYECKLSGWVLKELNNYAKKLRAKHD